MGKARLIGLYFRRYRAHALPYLDHLLLRGFTMQIQHLSHLQFPTEQRTGLAREDGLSADPAQAGVAISKQEKETRSPQTPMAPSSTAVHISARAPEPALYARPGQPTSALRGDDDSEHNLQRYEQALTRTAAGGQALSLDKDGILVARPRTAFSAQQSDFVALAVSAMRDFRDNAEHARTGMGPTASAASEASSNGLRGAWTQVAARFKAMA